ncbi:methyl-accepting chemotaxis protein [uncultured Acinetobacter sp.]|uniref:methyl-accepting chemotaxis protein n=1 Tax=uncultured Acinetobacter sp. TaxID=165433 RepID=UPI00260D4915|nr:methyl-accepting chemotaxis protein [uncultured Acinetobacter sp.]
MSFNIKKSGSDGAGLFNKVQDQVDQASRVFGDSERSKPYIYGAAFSLLLALVFLAYLLYSVPKNNSYTQSVGELRLLSQTLPNQAAMTTSAGTPEALKQLAASKDEFAAHLNNIQGKSDSDTFANIEGSWNKVAANVDLITAQQPLINQLYDANLALSESIPSIQAQYNLIIEQMSRQGSAGSQIAIAKNQVFLAERILNAMNSLMNGSENSSASAENLNTDVRNFAAFLNGQLNGNTALGVARVEDTNLRAALTNIKNEYDQVLSNAAAVVQKNAEPIAKVRQASSVIYNESTPLLNNLKQLSSSSSLGHWLPAIGLILALIGFLISVFKLLTLRGEADKERVARLQEEYDRNQNAILRLLDEIADLADGDLRSYATVSEDFTGAIADSINFAIDQLRDLVSRINETSQEVSQYTANTQHITNQLAEASEHQAQEIAGASSAINEMAMSIDEVSANASESAQVAERSVHIASNGADVVQRSIQGMDIIREQIQETSKRIKRLGESSQEIGNIVALINDIADQTNILALNAAIQASMAGEAGRGFAVVADEVQRLAERSASATKQIETLVKTIQTDTNEAVISMEQTTSEVVRGASLTKDAGVALGEIQSVSSNLAKLIANISDAAKLQSASAGHIANTMNVVQEITSQTTSATFDTARSVSELASMAEALRESVTDFKLPE